MAHFWQVTVLFYKFTCMLFWKPFYCLQIRKIRARMTEIITRDVSSGTVKELVEKLIPDSIADSILKRCRSIYPMQVCKHMQTRHTKQPLSKQLSRFKGFVHMAWKKPEHLMRLLPWVVYSLMRFSGHVDQPKLCTSIRLQSQDV